MIGTDLAMRLRTHWSDTQIVEHVLDAMKWSYQNLAVVLGADLAPADGESTELVFDANGDWRR